MQAKTFKDKVNQDSATETFLADDLGLGKYTTDDGIIYTFSSGTEPDVNSILIAEDTAGGTTLRRVISVSKSANGEIIVTTGDASLTDVLNRGSIYSSFKMFNVPKETDTQKVINKNTAISGKRTAISGSQSSRIEWKDNLLTVEQKNYTSNENKLNDDAQTKSSALKSGTRGGSQFSAEVSAEFEPVLITKAEWGGLFVKTLESAKVAAKGTLSFNALARYNFSEKGTWKKNWKLWERTWTSVYVLGASGIPVYQEITLKMDVAATASANSEVKALASAGFTETVEVGAAYDGDEWTPYISHDEKTSLTASLDIVGGANAEIRLIPSVEVRFYKVAGATLTVEPFAHSGLSFEETTNNTDFLAAHPDRLIQLSSFNASLGFETNLNIRLSALGLTWDALPKTCVLGSSNSCLYQFDPLKLFSIPNLSALQQIDTNDDDIVLEFTAADGKNNNFATDSVHWEVFPKDASISIQGCTKKADSTTCKATLTPGEENEYTVFASGHGVLKEIGRQFREVTINNRNNLFMEAFDIQYNGIPCYDDPSISCRNACYHPEIDSVYFEIVTDNPNINEDNSKFSIVLQCEYSDFNEYYPNYGSSICENYSVDSKNFTREITFEKWYDMFFNSDVIQVPLNEYCDVTCQIISNTGEYVISIGIAGCEAYKK